MQPRLILSPYVKVATVGLPTLSPNVPPPPPPPPPAPTPAPAPVIPPEVQADEHRERSARILAGLAAALFGVGALGRVGVDTVHAIGNQDDTAMDDLAAANSTPVMFKKPRNRVKRAADEPVDPGLVAKLWEAIKHPIDTAGKVIAAPVKGGKGWFSGADSTSWRTQPWMYAAAPPLALASLYGGYQAADWLGDKLRKTDVNDELDETKAEYERLMGLKEAKEAADDSTAHLFDKLASDSLDQLVKAPAMLDKQAAGFMEGVEALGGAGAGYALLTYLLGSKMGYDWFNKRTNQKVVQEAMRRRALLRSGGIVPTQMREMDAVPDSTFDA